MPENPASCSITAYRLPNRPTLKLIPAPADRVWMELTQAGWANRCLPLRMANQGGWWILNDADFEVTWNGKPTVSDLEIKPLKGVAPYFAMSSSPLPNSSAEFLCRIRLTEFSRTDSNFPRCLLTGPLL